MKVLLLIFRRYKLFGIVGGGEDEGEEGMKGSLAHHIV